MGVILIILGILLLFRHRPFFGGFYRRPYHRPPFDYYHEMHRPMGGPRGPMEHGNFGGPGHGRF